MSFVNVLPLEVVEQIFDYSLPRKNHAQLHGPPAQIDAHLPVIHEAPLSLSSVSKLWRNLALQLPFLWDSIAIVVPSYHKAGGHILVKHYLERSGALGLTIRLKSFDLEPTTLALFDLICTHIHRWKHVQFEVDGHFFNSRPFMSFTGDVQAYPMLQSVGMLSADTRSDRHGASALIDLAHLLDLSPNCTLVRWGGPTEVMLNYDLFPWNRLQDIELHNLLTIPQLYKLLNLCGKNLRTITSKHVVAQGLRLNAFPQDINLGLLTGLSFHGSVLGQLKVVTDHLTIPKLKHLHISTDAWSNFSDFGIPNLITRSECSLKSLRLRSVYMPPEDLEIILRASPDLSLLSITSDEPVIDDRLMDLMIPQPSNPSHDHLVPHLRTLQLVNTCLDIDIEDGKLASLLSSREQVNPFKYLQIKLPARVAAMHQKDRVEFNRYRFASSRHISFESMEEGKKRGQRGGIPQQVI